MARRHRAALVAGSLLSIAALLPPVVEFADKRLTLHMLFEMLLLAVAVPLLAYGIAPLLRLRVSVWMQALVGILALNLVLFAWQVPALLDVATRNMWLREAAPAAFMIGAFIFWQPIVRRDGLSAIAKIGYLMVAGVPPTIPGITLAFSHHVLYQAYRSIEDQQIAGLLLFGTAKLTLVAGTFVILWRMLGPEKEPPDWDVEEAPVDDTPPTAPAWLRRLDEELPAEPTRPRLPVLAGR
jgi:putative membrane protein